jgi:response regulator RpfG family c-di-GMP phosphodiesterase
MDQSTLIFKPETPDIKGDSPDKKKWKILIVDDEPDVHSTTRLVLDDFEFERAGLEFISAYSGKEAVGLMEIHEDIAVVLLDVVMETQHAGLDCARQIREGLKNHLVRIILRTGQPGQAPERKVIVEYDINDYKQKTDLTSQLLFTSVYTAIRSFRDMQAIERNRTGLKYIIEASGDLFKQQSIKKLAKGVLTQIAALFRLKNSFYLRGQGFTMAQGPEGDCEFIAATGKYADFDQAKDCLVLPPDLSLKLNQVAATKQSAYFDNNFLGYFPTQNQKNHILYMENCGREIDKEYEDLLNIFTRNVGVAFDNRYLNQEIQETQKEILLLLGELVESRSRETAYHVKRVAEYIGLLGRAAGYSDPDIELIKQASPMHDIGKIAIPDAILLKPGKLTRDEMEIMKSHTEIGYKILSASKRKLLKTAATIAISHHEKWDGTGYPKGLRGVEIPLAGRLTCLADVFDALCSERVYKPAWPIEEVFDYLRSQRGRTFDPYLVDTAVKAREEILVIRETYADAPLSSHS